MRVGFLSVISTQMLVDVLGAGLRRVCSEQCEVRVWYMVDGSIFDFSGLHLSRMVYIAEEK